MLSTVAVTGAGIQHTFEYSGTSGEISKIVFPYGGEFRYEYMTASFASGVKLVREVQYRRLVKQPGATSTSHRSAYDHGPSAPLHFARSWRDETTGADKLWYFALANDYTRGMVTNYLERTPTGSTVNEVAYTWSLSPSGVTFASMVSQTGAHTSRSGQSIDAYGNVLTRTDYGATNPPVPVRTTTCTYLTNPVYLNRYLRNLPISCTLAADGTSYSLFTNVYDQMDTNAAYTGRLHDSANYTPQFTIRGNVASWTKLGGQSGIAWHSANGSPTVWNNNGVGSQASQFDGNNDQPTSISQVGVQTSLSYTPFRGLASLTPSNSNGFTFSYDAYARPASQTSVDGLITFTYMNASGSTLANRTATVAGRWTKTHFDGFGRTVKEETGDSSGTKSIGETEYAPCACTPMGKVSRVSRPYAPGGTSQWTTYTYDSVGRTLSVAQPGGTGSTTYAYTGSQTTVTDPSGKWKKFTTDAFGNLVQVNEPNPAGGADLITTYTYNGLDRLVQVSMPRDGYTQTRTFVYNNLGQLTSETIPESGTTTYTYGQYGRIATKTDAKSQRSEWSYDSHGRVTQERHYSPTNQEMACERVDYRYDSYSDGTAGSSLQGRLAEVTWGSKDTAICRAGLLVERYGYETWGRPRSRVFKITQGISGTPREATLASEVYYNGRQVSSVHHPDPSSGPGTDIYYTFDSMGRPLTMKEGCCGTPDVTNAQYGPAGELTQVTYGSTTEARSYNILGQLTGISYNGTLRHEYRYSATANDGRLTSYKNWQSGEDVQYQYDSLARLTSAQTVGPEWGQSFGYDGFGNLLSKAVTKGTATVLSVTADPATNRISGLSYDANGNVKNLSGVGVMSYDGRNRFVGDTSTGQLPTRGYDPSNRKIWSFTGAGDFQFDFYSPIGQKLGTYRVYWPGAVTGPATIVPITEYKYFAGRVIRVNGPSGAVYPMEDRLGSTVPHLPYGDEINPTAQDRVKFATYYRESSGVLDYAMNRYYSPVYGRFTSPDPYRASAGPASPGSWNRYVYAEGDPINRYDPDGLEGDDPQGGCTMDGLWWPDYFCSMSTGSARVSRRGLDPAPLTTREAWILADGLKRLVNAGHKTDCQALSDFALNVADRASTNEQFMQAFGVLVPKQAASSVLRYWNSNAVLLGGTGNSGFAKPLENTVADSPGGNGDQGHHFAAFFQFGYQYGAVAGGVASNLFELAESLVGNGSINYGDVALGMVAAEIGAKLKAGKLSKEGVSSAIGRLCDK